MGISVPIGAEHYKHLKEISEKLGLGLKKTVEYLVTYYLQREMKNMQDERIVSLPPKEIPKEQQYKEIVASTFASITSPKLANTVPPAVVSTGSISKNQPTAHRQTPSISKTVSTNCPSCNAPRRINAKFCYNCGNLL